MARPERRNVDYFPHYISHGSKMQYLQNKYGNSGYAVWYKIMEKLAKADSHYIDLSDDLNLELFADFCLIDIETLNSIINFLCRAKWMHQKLWNDYKVLHSTKFLESIEDAYKRRNNVCINTEAIELMYYNNSDNVDNKPQSKVEYSKVNKSIEERKADFKKSLLPFKDFGDEILKEFFSYWTEHGAQDKKMRFEKEKSFGINRRLTTWLKNKEKFNKKTEITYKGKNKGYV